MLHVNVILLWLNLEVCCLMLFSCLSTGSDLEECLLVMPFDQVLQFLHLSITWLEVCRV